MSSIRSITFFEGSEDAVGSLPSDLDATKINSAISDRGIDIRTLRYTLSPIYLTQFSDFDEEISILSGRLRSLENLGFRWANQPFLCDGLSAAGVDLIVENSLKQLLSKEHRLFSSLSVTKRSDIAAGSDLYSKISKSISRSDLSGFSNFRFGMGANISAGTPYYPFAYSNKYGFSVAVESLPIFVATWKKHKCFKKLSSVLLNELMTLQNCMEQVAENIGLPFFGLDWSLAPLPNSEMSVCSLIEEISGVPIGSPGCLSVIENLTSALKEPIGVIKGVGFNGVMLSVMEDDILAERFGSGHVTINELLLYSTVCGCGLDMIPIAGSESEKSIARITSDLAHLAFRLNKPLGVRLLSIETKAVGEQTSFAHDFVTNTSVSHLR
jgi:uncharacterized protein